VRRQSRSLTWTLFATLAGAISALGLAAATPLVDDGRRQNIQGTALRTHLFSRDVEMALALSAGPAHLRDAATVYVFMPGGYIRTRIGTSGVSCIVNRDAFLDGYEALKPTCFDAEGTARIVPMILREGELLAKGQDAATIRRTIEDAFTKKELEPPRRPGIAYMLQGDVSSIDGKTGAVAARSHPPHLMFYAPGLTDTDFAFGKTPIEGLAVPPFVYRRNPYHGYVIVTLSK
jgi:hypothetical protein